MLEEAPELYQNEGRVGIIPNIPVGTTWRTRYAFSYVLS